MDCGATCLRMIARHYGRFYSLEYLRELTFVGKDGVALIDIADAAEKIGMNSLAAKVNWKRLADGLPLPMIAHWRQQHFVVVYEMTPQYVRVADPASGKYKLSREEFLDGWASDTVNGEEQGIILLLETTPEFLEREGDKTDKSGFRFLFSYLFRYKRLLVQLLLGMLLGSVFQLVMPFLMQAVVDVGISTSNIDFIKLVLVGQMIVFFSQASVEFIRGWILLHIGTRVNISLVSDFLMMDSMRRFWSGLRRSLVET